MRFAAAPQPAAEVAAPRPASLGTAGSANARRVLPYSTSSRPCAQLSAGCEFGKAKRPTLARVLRLLEHELAVRSVSFRSWLFFFHSRAHECARRANVVNQREVAVQPAPVLLQSYERGVAAICCTRSADRPRERLRGEQMDRCSATGQPPSS
jgi:hypothetical protein